MTTTHVCFADMPVAAVNAEGPSALSNLKGDAIRECRSVSPNCSNSPVPRYERNMGFFRQLSRRFGLRSNDDLVFATSNEDDNQSSSTDSCASSQHTPAAAAIAPLRAGDNNQKTSDYTLCASSETSSTVDITEQMQRLQLQQQQQQQQQQQYIDCAASNDFGNNSDDTAVHNNENSDDAVRPTYIQERTSVARSSFTRQHRRSSSSIRRAFEAFSLSSRSLSCSGATPPPILPTSPSPSPTTNNGTPFKSALKSSSHQELNKKSHTYSFTRKFSICSVSTAAGKSAASSSAQTPKSKTKPPPQRILRQPVSYTYLKGISGLPTQRVPRNSVCCQYARR